MKLPLLLLGALAMAPTAVAQNNPWWEFGGAYQFGRADFVNGPQQLADSITAPAGLPKVNAGPTLNTNGFELSLQENSARWWGGIADFTANYGVRNIDASNVASALGLDPSGMRVIAHFHPSSYTLTYGPQFTHRGWGHIEGFARTMVGGVWSHLSPDPLTRKALTLAAPRFNPSDTSFALIAGAGFDYPWKHRIVFRISEDYIRTFLYNEGQNNFRLDAGINFRFGRR
jgi:hypothetical protein